MTPATFEAMQNTEYGAMAAIYNSSIEAKALGVVERPLTQLFKSRIAGIDGMRGTAKVGRQSINLPYIQRIQRSKYNANYFVITAGSATPGAGSNGVHPGSWDVTVQLSDSPWSVLSPIKNLERYFLPGKTVIILNWNNDVDKVAQTLQFTVTSAVNANAGGVEKAKITLVPNITASGWGELGSGEDEAYQPVSGVLQTGLNSVHDYESWCYQQPAENPVGLIVNWLQTFRTSRCMSDEYKKTLDLVFQGKVNSFFQNFNGLIPVAEQNKQAAALDDREWVRSLWWGQAANEKQTPEFFSNIENAKAVFGITDPEDPSCFLDFGKTKALGVEATLYACQRVIDMGGQPLDADFIIEQLYYLKRHREQDGDSIGTIDVHVDRFTADTLFQMFNRYMKEKYGVVTERSMALNQKITLDGAVDLKYNLYDIPDAGVSLAVFWSEELDDHLAAFPANMKARGRNMFFIDWSDIQVGTTDAKTVNRQYPLPNALGELYKCRMAVNTKQYVLKSLTYTLMLDRPHRHLLITNFSNACPKLTIYTCS